MIIVKKDVKDSEEMNSYLDYYIKKKVNGPTVIYELHGNFWVKDIDISKWDMKKANTVSARIGIYDKASITDWMLLKMTTTDGKQTWSCEDGYSRSGSKVYTKDSSDVSACLVNIEKSFYKQEDGKEATAKIHWMRVFDSGVANNDLKLKLGNYTVDL